MTVSADFLAAPTDAEKASLGRGVVDLFVAVGNALGGGNDDSAAQAAARAAEAARRRNLMIAGAALLLVGGVVVYRFVLKR